MSIYYKYAPYGSNLFVLFYVDDCVYWYTPEELGKLFLDTLGNRFHINFLGYANWFMYISIYQIKDYWISVDQDMYATSVVKISRHWHNKRNPQIPCLMICYSPMNIT